MAIVNLTHTGSELDQAISNVLANYVDTSDATALQGEILNTKTAYVNGVKVTGNMVNRGAVSGEVTTRDGVYTVPVGYHNGSGQVEISDTEQAKIISGNIKSGVTILGVAGATNVVDTTNEVNSATDVTLLSGKKAFVNGESLTGTMPNIGQQTVDISAKATSVTPSTGYHNGSGVIKIATAEQDKIIAGNIKLGVTILGVDGSLDASGIDTSDATAAVGDILTSKTAYVNGNKLTGTMPNIGTQTATISTKAGTVTPTQGYHNGLGSISINTNEQAKIIAGNIKSGVTLLGVTGSLSEGIDTSDATAIAGEILNTKTAYVNGVKVTGTMVNNGQQIGDIYEKATTVIPIKGYHNGSGAIKIATAEQDKIIAGNIKSGVTLLGVTGSLSEGIDTSDATAVQAEILNGETAYIASGKVTGSMPNNAGNVNAVSYHADGTSLHIVPAQGYTDGSDDATVITDSDFTAGNIADGVSIFGLIGTLTGGSPPTEASPKDINFYDYDGFLCYSWTLAELASASALPANPTHAGLTAQGWNWSLADLKTENAKMNVGQMYVTDDGKTRLYITIAALGRMVVPLYWSQTVESGVSINWGDGSSAETFTGTGNKNTTHTYAAIGDYMITLTVTSGVLGLGDGTSAYSVMGSTSSTGRVYQNMLNKAEIGSNVSSINTYAFSYCYSLASVTIPNNVSSINNYAFQYCYSLASVTIPSDVSSIATYVFQYCQSLSSITIPSGVSSIGTYAFRNCSSLASITIPSNVSSIGNYTFAYCYSLASITIPSNVSSIGDNAFNGCEGVAAYHILPVTPPSLANVNAFTNIPSDCVIYVPNASLATYQEATKWSTYEAKMVGE